ncbi:hypothetical protein VIOR3934_08361 [Vibrio orientalis CIP 102891 = ATCC 33934]|uniref:Uncharacterized protein n=1 Tax=Vibrio orientalis CIP 102891 = ATCC 33934 TaxID=675816 RepID=C9QFM8_VIBOR|nr:hypothetical protein [Vibrio orientalis]EEX94064.1 hypothetical protein VIA_001222 [Vibrio orientalis CIP 102891 = ATCC 33934]EGU52793.1 hypothetical protein VIOR3934_08361 [Vibrio orientalis CIP 102891 = ATCC 33934]
MVTNKCKTLALAALVLAAPISVSAQTQAVLAESIALPTLSVLSGKQLKLSLAGVECGQNEYFTDSANVSILANGTPLEFIRTCHDSVLAFTPINRSENTLFVEILLKNRNLNLRYMAGARSYAYNDWQLAPVKEVLK